ncbi:hypothetical protein K0M31_012384 [Melipona bicolor]|uniref:Uncharacterized protein n=1 Tax=Melipona bicolor TaxID=60889 RepID=A0AA40FKL8_9HYME|nr:hypothetical protein K0M31_012384 [Melipona bicolor]
MVIDTVCAIYPRPKCLFLSKQKCLEIRDPILGPLLFSSTIKDIPTTNEPVTIEVLRKSKIFGKATSKYTLATSENILFGGWAYNLKEFRMRGGRGSSYSFEYILAEPWRILTVFGTEWTIYRSHVLESFFRREPADVERIPRNRGM